MTRFHKIGIIGLGLIGGSIAKKLHAQGYSLYTLKSKFKDTQKAKPLLTAILPTLSELANEVDLLILASPLSTIIPIAQKIKAKHPLLVIDVGSVKTPIVKAFEKLTSQHVEFLATHPMAGTEKQGFEASSEGLFEDAPWIIVPHKKNKTPISSFIRELGAKPIQMGAKEHDEKVALISHLPMLLSQALRDFVQQKDPSSTQIAGPSFRSMTRLASSNPALLHDIKKHNKLIINNLWKKWICFLSKKKC